MKLWLLIKTDQSTGEQQLNLFFLRRSALKLAQRIIKNCGVWDVVQMAEDSTATNAWQCGAYLLMITPLGLRFREWSLKRWFRQRCHWQNLNTKGREEVTGSILRHGRAWFRFKKDDYNAPSLHWSWNFWTHFFGFDITIGCGDSDRDIQFFFGCGLIAFWFTIENILSKQFLDRGREKALKTKWMGFEYMAWPRVTGIRFHDGSIWFEIWNWDAGWSADQPKWLSFSFNFLDFFLGRSKYSSEVIDKDTRTLVMPESSYLVVIELRADRWKRPRWFFTKSIVRAHIAIENGIPIPGKGENSWDCDEDATFGLTCQAKTFDEAISKLYASVMSSRERHGGKNWLPSEKLNA